jgi:hypothetical protein
MKYQHQIDETDCGPACLVMAASHYKLYISIGYARRLCKTDRLGTNLGGLAVAAQKLCMDAKAMHGEVSDKTLDSKLIYRYQRVVFFRFLAFSKPPTFRTANCGFEIRIAIHTPPPPTRRWVSYPLRARQRSKTPRVLL